VHPVRVLVGSLPHGLQDTVTEVLAGMLDIDVSVIATNPSGLLRAAGTLRADVVVVAAVDGDLPGLATHLLDQYPDIRVVALAPEGRTALTYALHPRTERYVGSTVAELARTLRAACHDTE
jgi:uncharacterized NAD-dependent epimerase/dehydratase family protein